MEQDTINGRTFFYYDDKNIELQKQIIKNEWNLLLDNYNLVNFDLVRFKKSNGDFFNYNHPNNHSNILLNLPNYTFQYYHSFPSTHKSCGSIYYELISKNDFNDFLRNQYWRPHLSVNNKLLVDIKKFNLINSHNNTLNSYMLKNTLHDRIRFVFTTYLRK